MSPQLQFGPGVPGREALGAKSLEDFLGTGAGLEDEDRAVLVREDATGTWLRYPLPGTPRDDGRLTGPPRGAGTGWVRLVRYRGAGLVQALRARFTAPRSESLAAREWNLLCTLRANGVATPEPLAVGGTARRSFLVTREHSDVQRVSEWLLSAHGGEARRLGLAALAALLGRVLRSGVRLPRLASDALFIGLRQEECEESNAPIRDARVRRLPPVYLTDVVGGSLGPKPDAEESARRLRALYDRLTPAERPTERECYALFVRALRGLTAKVDRRGLWRTVAPR